jgi:hypothetical protein
MAQEMYKHDALLHLLWAVAIADRTPDDEKYGAVSSAEDEYYEKIRKDEGINISFGEIADKREALIKSIGAEGIINEALKATNGCSREWRIKVLGYMMGMSFKSKEVQDNGMKTQSRKESAIIERAGEYFGLTMDEQVKSVHISLGFFNTK